MIPKKRKSTRGDDSSGTSSTSVLLNNSIPSCQTRIAHGPLMHADSISESSEAMQTNSPSDSEEDEENILRSEEEIVPVIQPYVPPQVDDLMSTMTIVPVVRRKSQDMAIVPGIQLHFWGFPENKAQRYGIEDMDRDVYSVIPVANMDWNQEGSEFVSAMFQPFNTQGEATSPLTHPFEQKPTVSESQQFDLAEGVFDETNRDQGGIMILDDEQVADLADKMLASVQDIIESEGSEIQEIFKKKGSMDESEMEVPRGSEDNEGKEDIYDAIFAGQSNMDPEQQFIKEANAFIDEQGEPKKPKKCGCKNLGKDGKPLNKPCVCKKRKSLKDVPVIEEKPQEREETETVSESEMGEVGSSVKGEETSEQDVPEEKIELNEPTENEEQKDTGEADVEQEAEEETTAPEDLPDTGGEEVEADAPVETGEEAVEVEEPSEPEERPESENRDVEPEEPQESSDNGEEAVLPDEGEESIVAEEPPETEEEVVEEEIEVTVPAEEVPDTGEAEIEEEEPSTEEEKAVELGEGGEDVELEEPVEAEGVELPDTGEDEVEEEQPPEEVEEGIESEEPAELAEVDNSDHGEEAAEPEETVDNEGVELPDTGEDEVEEEQPPEEVEEDVESEEPAESAEEDISDHGEEAAEPEETVDNEGVEFPDTGEDEVEEEQPSEEVEEGVESEEPAESAEEDISDHGEEAAEQEETVEDGVELPDTGEDEVEEEQPSEEVEEGVEYEEPAESAEEDISDHGEEAAEPEETVEDEGEELPATVGDEFESIVIPEGGYKGLNIDGLTDVEYIDSQVASESEKLPDESEITDDGNQDTSQMVETVPKMIQVAPALKSRELIEELSRCACCCMKLLLAQGMPVTTQMPSPDELPCLAAQIAIEGNIVPGDEITVEEGSPDEQLASDFGEPEYTMEPTHIPDDIPDSGEEMVSDIETVPDFEEVPISEGISDVTDESDAGEISESEVGYKTISVEGPSQQEDIDAPVESDIEEVPVTEAAEDSVEVEFVECIDESPVVEEVPESEELDEVTDGALDSEAQAPSESEETQPEEAIDETSEEAPDSAETDLGEVPDSGEEEALAAEEVPDSGEEEALAAEEFPDSGEEEALAAEELPDSGDEGALADEEIPDLGEEEALAAEEVPDSGEEGATASEEIPTSGETESDEVMEDALLIDSREVVVCGEEEIVDEEMAPEISEPVITEEDVDIGDVAADQEIDATEMPEGEELAEVSKSEDEEEAQEKASVAEETADTTEGEEGSSAPEEIPSELEEMPTDELGGAMQVEPSDSAAAEENEIIRKELSELVTIVVSLEGGIAGKKQGEEEFPGSGDQLLTKMPGPSCTEESIIERELSNIIDSLFLPAHTDKSIIEKELLNIIDSLYHPAHTDKSIIGKELSNIIDSLFRPAHTDKSIIGKELSALVGKLFRSTAPVEDQQIVPLTDEQIIAREISILIDKAIATVEGVPMEFLRPDELVPVGPPTGTIIDINLVIKKRRHLQRKRIYTSFEFQEQKDVIEEEPEAADGAIGDQPIADDTLQEEGEPAEPSKEDEAPKEDEVPPEAEVVPPETVEPEPCPEPPREMPEESSNEKYRMKKFLAEFDIQMAPLKDRIRDLQKQVVGLGIPEFDRIIVLEPAFFRDPPAERPFEMPCKPCKKRPQPSKKNKRPFPPCCTQQTACPQAAPTNSASVCASQFPPNYQPVPCSCSRAPTLEQNPAPRNQPAAPRPTKCQCSSPKPGCGQK